MLRTIALGLLLAAGSGLSVHADNWPQWRGPQLDGTSKETGLPIEVVGRRERRVEDRDAGAAARRRSSGAITSS